MTGQVAEDIHHLQFEVTNLAAVLDFVECGVNLPIPHLEVPCRLHDSSSLILAVTLDGNADSFQETTGRFGNSDRIGEWSMQAPGPVEDSSETKAAFQSRDCEIPFSTRVTGQIGFLPATGRTVVP